MALSREPMDLFFFLESIFLFLGNKRIHWDSCQVNREDGLQILPFQKPEKT